MTATNLIVPPPELVEQWRTQPEFADLGLTTGVSMTQSRLQDIATQAAQWGADQELEACCEYMQHVGFPGFATILRVARRPEPPRLAKRALHILGAHGDLSCAEHDTIRRALEALDD